MALKPFRKVRLTNAETRQLQDACEIVFRDLQRPILAGRLIKDISLSSGTEKKIEHKLGRVPEGHIIVYRSASSTIYNSSESTANLLSLTASADVTVNLWVF